MEQWRSLHEYSGYEVSNIGRVRNISTGHVIAIVRQGDNRPGIALFVGGVQIRRGLAKLVCETFKTPPRNDFDTPIHLDGDLMNCRVNNLEWRPRWFAIQHTEQFRKDLGDSGPVRNIDTGIIYQDIWEVVFSFGLLYNDVVKSIINKTWVFPIMQCFEWIDPD